MANGGKKRIGLKALLTVLLGIILLAVTGCGSDSGGGSPAGNAKPANKPRNQIFEEDRRFGIKRDGEVIADPVWYKIEEVVDGDLVYYVVGYKDEARAKKIRDEYDTSIIDYDVFWGILDEDGKIVAEPQYYRIKYGNKAADSDRTVPYECDYVFCVDYVDNGKTTQYTNLKTGEPDLVLKHRDRIEYAMRKGTWQIEFNLGEYSFTDVHGDLLEVTTVSSHGLYSISRQQLLGHIEKAKNWKYHPGIGFTAGSDLYPDKDMYFIGLNCSYVQTEVPDRQIRIDEEHGIVWAAKDSGFALYSSKWGGGYVLYDCNCNRIGDFIADYISFDGIKDGSENRVCLTGDGRMVQLVVTLEKEIQLFDHAGKTIKTIEGAEQAGEWSEGFAPVANADGKWAYIDDKGDFLCSYQFDEAKPFENGQAKVIDGYKMYTIDTQGNLK